jgi:hypothetical protein
VLIRFFVAFLSPGVGVGVDGVFRLGLRERWRRTGGGLRPLRDFPRQDRAPGDGPHQGMRARKLVRHWSLPNPPKTFPSSNPKITPTSVSHWNRFYLGFFWSVCFHSLSC